MSEPVRAVKASEDLDEQFDGIVDALRRDVRTLRQQVERYGRTYQKRAEDRSRQTTHGELDEETQRGYRRLKQLQLVIQHIESSAAYFLGSVSPKRSATTRPSGKPAAGSRSGASSTSRTPGSLRWRSSRSTGSCRRRSRTSTSTRTRAPSGWRGHARTTAGCCTSPTTAWG